MGKKSPTGLIREDYISLKKTKQQHTHNSRRLQDRPSLFLPGALPGWKGPRVPFCHRQPHPMERTRQQPWQRHCPRLLPAFYNCSRKLPCKRCQLADNSSSEFRWHTCSLTSQVSLELSGPDFLGRLHKYTLKEPTQHTNWPIPLSSLCLLRRIRPACGRESTFPHLMPSLACFSHCFKPHMKLGRQKIRRQVNLQEVLQSDEAIYSIISLSYVQILFFEAY